MDNVRLDEAVKLAIANENPDPRTMTVYLATTTGASEPFDTPIGPVKDAGGPAGWFYGTVTSWPSGAIPSGST